MITKILHNGQPLYSYALNECVTETEVCVAFDFCAFAKPYLFLVYNGLNVCTIKPEPFLYEETVEAFCESGVSWVKASCPSAWAGAQEALDT